MTLRIANGAGFLGDQLDAPRRLVEQAEIDYLTLEHLAELTMSILARAREKNPTAGYALDFIEILQSLTPSLSLRDKLRIVTNAGGMNPVACAQAASRVLMAAGLGATSIGVVTGDDLLPRLQQLQAAGCRFENLDTGEALASLSQPVVSANAYLGARSIYETLSAGARIVITGRVADASLTLGPAVYEFGWSWDEWNRLAAASVAGHIIECGAQATGGYLQGWQSLDLANVGYPIAELESSGECTITKPAGSGGAVNRRTVTAQLVYEIGDPRHYLTPDVDVDFTTLELTECGPDRIGVTGATGRPAPQSLKVSVAYRAGFQCSGQLLVYGEDCVAKAKACAEMILSRVRRAGISLERTNVECLGAVDSVPGFHSPPAGLREVMLRIAVSDPRRESLERFAKEIAPLITSGPPGLAGYAAGRPEVRPMFAYWPTLVPRDLVQATVQVRSAEAWSNQP